MASTTYLVESFQVAAGYKSTATFRGIKVLAQGYLACHGNDHTFTVYFLHPKSAKPSPLYDADSKRGAIFVPSNYMDTYLSLANGRKPVYAYMNDSHPEWNHLRASKPKEHAIEAAN